MSGLPQPTPPRGRGRPPTLDRIAALDAAWKVVAERGLERTRYADVARASGAPVSTLQNAFGSLQALLNAAIDQAAGRDAAYLTELPGEDEATALHRLERLIVGSFEEPDAFESWLVWLELWRAAARNPTLVTHTAAAYGPWWSTSEEIIRHGQRTGEFTSDVDPEDMAIAAIAVIDGCACALLLRAGSQDPENAGRIAFETISRALAA